MEEGQIRPWERWEIKAQKNDEASEWREGMHLFGSFNSPSSFGVMFLSEGEKPIRFSKLEIHQDILADLIKSAKTNFILKKTDKELITIFPENGNFILDNGATYVVRSRKSLLCLNIFLS